jgi:hypothetical protein
VDGGLLLAGTALSTALFMVGGDASARLRPSEKGQRELCQRTLRSTSRADALKQVAALPSLLDDNGRSSPKRIERFGDVRMLIALPASDA